MTQQPYEEIEHKREVKSYVLRSRMTDGQQTGLEQFWPLFGVDLSDGNLDLIQLFQRDAPTFLEIGFGMGSSLVKLAEANKNCNFLGIEVHKPGVGAILSALHEKKLTNVRVICEDARQVIKNHLRDDCLQGVFLFFPDPWPKRRHHKRRIVQPDFVSLIHQKLQPGGYFHLATDIKEYASHMLRVVASHPNFAIINKQMQLPVTLERPRTKFEQRGVKLGHSITDLIFLKNG